MSDFYRGKSETAEETEISIERAEYISKRINRTMRTFLPILISVSLILGVAALVNHGFLPAFLTLTAGFLFIIFLEIMAAYWAAPSE